MKRTITLRWASSVVLSLSALLLAACGDDAAPPPPVAPVARPKSAPAAVAAASAGAPQYIYSYNPIGKRDPFKEFSDPTEGGGGRPVDVGPCSEPLCQMDLDALKVVAVVSGDANPLAMLEDSTGTGHVVRRNAKIGRAGGKVTAIQRDCLVVTSFVQGADGKAQANKVNLCIKEDDQTKSAVDLMQGK